MTTYIISREQYSEKAQEKYGYGFVWPVIGKHRGRLPQDEESFHKWLLGMLRAKGYSEGRIKIIRPQAKDERAGFHLCWLGYVSEHDVTTEKSMRGEVKAIPRIGTPPKSLPWSRQPWYQQKDLTETRKKFHRS